MFFVVFSSQTSANLTIFDKKKASERLELIVDEAKRNLEATRRELDAVRSKLGAQVDSLTTSLKIANLEAEDKELKIATLEHTESSLRLALQQSQMIVDKVTKVTFAVARVNKMLQRKLMRRS